MKNVDYLQTTTNLAHLFCCYVYRKYYNLDVLIKTYASETDKWSCPKQS